MHVPSFSASLSQNTALSALECIAKAELKWAPQRALATQIQPEQQLAANKSHSLWLVMTGELK